MNDARGEPTALGPLWGLTLGAAASSSLSILVTRSPPGWVPISLVLIGIGFVVVALRFRLRSPVMWLIAGLALAGAHGAVQLADRHQLDRLIDPDDPVWIRGRLAITEGWSRGRWGWRTRVRVIQARHESERIPPLRRVRLEIRGVHRPSTLPPPGAEVDGLFSIRGSPQSPLLVAPSQRVLGENGETDTLPRIRDAGARHLFVAAGTDLRRIRAAELAAALSLGRRDLIPRERREGWRRSGFAHVLAVSGLHVGLVAGMLWIIFAVGGASPTTSRIAVLLVLPSYALLAGGSPSAIRAALMGSIYVAARLLGRAIVPMAAVLLTAALLLISDPSLIAEVSFQLTVVLTAALVRWVPPIAAALPFPSWLSGAIAVPVVAQIAAAPIVATHFGTLVPGAAAANLLVPWLLGPLVLASVGATVVAPISPTAAGGLLDLTDLASRALWWAGGPGRVSELVPPPIPAILIALLIVLGILALLPFNWSRLGAAGYGLGLAVAAAWWLAVPTSASTDVELLPVSYGLSVRVTSSGDHLLMDGGALQQEAAASLARARIRDLTVVIASHGDEDHVGGLETVLRTSRVHSLVMPRWLTRAREGVPLLRTARRAGTRVVPVVRGSRVDIGPGQGKMDILWPPVSPGLTDDNERSLVARLLLPEGSVLLTADIGGVVERQLVESTQLDSTILIVPHHGSRGSSTAEFLDAVSPTFALIPAGPKNTHNHPHPDVLKRLEERGIRVRTPIRDGRCGATIENGAWTLYPHLEPPGR